MTSFSMQTDGQTDRNDKANSCFSQFLKSPKKSSLKQHILCFINL